MKTFEELFREELDRIVMDEICGLRLWDYDREPTLYYLERLAKANGVSRLDHITSTDITAWNERNEEAAGAKKNGLEIIDYSLRKIVKAAAEKAVDERRTTLLLTDIQHGLEMHFGTVYPFCKRLQ